MLKAIQIKTRWLKRFMKNRNKNSMEYIKYKLYRDKINHLIRASKKIIINHISLKINIIPKRLGQV